MYILMGSLMFQKTLSMTFFIHHCTLNFSSIKTSCLSTLQYHYCSFSRMALELNNLQSLKYH